MIVIAIVQAGRKDTITVDEVVDMLRDAAYDVGSRTAAVYKTAKKWNMDLIAYEVQ